ncbi:MAG: hypothetical protein JO283_01515 [Bradyrhizobium sp.]|nr:hypothetical protein [Bradyrhizobium sp.]
MAAITSIHLTDHPKASKWIPTSRKNPSRTDVTISSRSERSSPGFAPASPLMGFGFVVVHFGISADGPHIGQHAGIQPYEPTLWFGTLIIIFGVAANLFSAWRFVGLACELRRGPVLRRYLSLQGVVVALVLALLGVVMTIYMVSISGAQAGAMGQ